MIRIRTLLILVIQLFPIVAWGQFEFDSPPINYSQSNSNDKISELISKLKSGKIQLEWDESRGWLPDVLKALDVDASSQTLVFSKTSMQIRHISPNNPRAIYFNDDVYVGYVPGGEVLELSAVDSNLGAVFYSLRQEKSKLPAIARDQDKCMTCHGTSKTKNVPGYLTRSVFASASGHPHYSMGTVTTDHTTAFRDRFGGWYVTGQHGDLRHRGNVIAKNDPSDPIDREAGANQIKLPENIARENYAAETSDLVALMVLEHQTQMHNLITNAAYETRQALHYQATLNKALDRPADYRSESTTRRISSAGNKLLTYMLFNDEAKLTSEVRGSSSFAKRFEAAGVLDSKGRSLRQLDLNERMFTFPCSFLIYSESFEHLPTEVKSYVLSQLVMILKGQDASVACDHLSDEDRRAILEILTETLPSFAAELKTQGKR